MSPREREEREARPLPPPVFDSILDLDLLSTEDSEEMSRHAETDINHLLERISACEESSKKHHTRMKKQSRRIAEQSELIASQTQLINQLRDEQSRMKKELSLLRDELHHRRDRPKSQVLPQAAASHETPPSGLVAKQPVAKQRPPVRPPVNIVQSIPVEINDETSMNGI